MVVAPVSQPAPHTVDSLAANLRTLGVTEGDVLLLHSSLRAVGFVAGGPHAVVLALLAALGPGGTLVVPTHTPGNSDPAQWRHPPVPESWWPIIRERTPGFDPARTPSQWMGKIAETVRTWPGARRSDHPQVSFAALGRHAADVVGEHPLDDALGDRSPLGAVYRLDGKVLLLGCGHGSNTSLHLAEWRQPAPRRESTGAAVRRPDGTSHWVSWTDVAPDASDFARLGADYEATGPAPSSGPASSCAANDGPVRVGPVGRATARLAAQRPLVDYATAWLATHRR